MVLVTEAHQVHLHGVVHQVHLQDHEVQVLDGEVRLEAVQEVLAHHGVGVHQEVVHVVHSVEVEEDNHGIYATTKRQG